MDAARIKGWLHIEWINYWWPHTCWSSQISKGLCKKESSRNDFFKDPTHLTVRMKEFYLKRTWSENPEQKSSRVMDGLIIPFWKIHFMLLCSNERLFICIYVSVYMYISIYMFTSPYVWAYVSIYSKHVWCIYLTSPIAMQSKLACLWLK